MSVGKLLSGAFYLARSQHQELARIWIQISASVGSRLPSSLLEPSIQRDGEMDLLLRSLEDEVAQNMASQSAHKDQGFISHYMNSISTYWVGGFYETFRLLKERQLADTGDLFESIFRHLELLRITLEKHEIAKDPTLQEPLTMTRYPPNHDSTDAYTYNRDDKKRAHIMPMGVSQRGSMIWQTIDLRTKKGLWIERRGLSDQIVELWRAKQQA